MHPFLKKPKFLEEGMLRYPKLACFNCLFDASGFRPKLKNVVMQNGRCELCKKKGLVMSPRYFKSPTFFIVAKPKKTIWGVDYSRKKERI